MKKIILCGIFIIVLSFTFVISSGKSMAYTRSNNANVTYTSSNTKDDTAKRALKQEKNMTKITLVAIGGGALFSSIICGILVSIHKPVRVARGAKNYLDNNKVSITRREDFFMRSSVDKHEK